MKKSVKVQILLSAVLFWLGMVTLIVSGVVVSQGVDAEIYALTAMIVTIFAVAWFIVSKVRGWWQAS